MCESVLLLQKRLFKTLPKKSLKQYILTLVACLYLRKIIFPLISVLKTEIDSKDDVVTKGNTFTFFNTSFCNFDIIIPIVMLWFLGTY